MKKNTSFGLSLILIVILGLVAALPLVVSRVGSEQRNNSTEVLFDYAALNDYARRSGTSLDTLLAWCKANGVTAIAVEENSRDSLSGRGLARAADYFEMSDLQSQKRISQAIKLDPMCAYYVAKDNDTATKIKQGAAYSLGSDRARILPNDKGQVVELACDIRDLPTLGLGIPYDIVKELHNKYGFQVWLRPWNSPKLDETNLANIFKVYAQLAKDGQIEGLIFGGLRNEVYGYPKKLATTASLLEEANLKLGVIELAPKTQQKGIVTLAKLCPERVVRVMAVSPSHQAKLDPDTVISMFSLGVRERTIRLVYCRPYLDGVEKLSLEEANSAFMSGIHQTLAPLFKGQASTYSKADNLAQTGFTLWSLAITLISASVTLCFILLINLLSCENSLSKSFWGARQATILLFLVVGITALSCLSGLGCHWVRVLLALAAVTVMPILAYVVLVPFWEQAEEGASIWSALGDGLVVMAVSVSLTLYGGLLAGALLSDLNYMLSLDVFRGVKLHSLLVPLVIFTIWLVQQGRSGGLDSLIRFLESEVKLWHVVLFFVFAIVAAFYLIRTGNNGGDLVVSESERAFRRWLDTTLGVRPRFKEFLLGNPALLLLPTLVFLRWRSCIPLAVLAGAVGMASLSDTYGHIHTPILISLQRTTNGVILGCFIGIALALLAYALKNLLVPYTKLLVQPSQGQAAAQCQTEEDEAK